MVKMKKDSFIRFALSPIKQYIKLAIFKAKWRKVNQHNRSNAVNVFPIEKVKVGNGTYGSLEVYAFGRKKEGLEIGNYCSIAGSVVFILGGEHRMDTISTFPFSRHIFGKIDNPDNATKGKIKVDDDVWIGHGAIILSGVHIGQGAVIGAGSVVAKDVPPYAVYVGNQVKKYRFSKEIIEKLLKINYKRVRQKNTRKI